MKTKLKEMVLGAWCAGLRPLLALVVLSTSLCASAKNYVAQIGSVKYETVQDAIDAWAEGDCVVMINDSTEPTVVVTNQNVMLDLCGYVLKNDGTEKTVTDTEGNDLVSKSVIYVESTGILKMSDSSPVPTNHYFQVRDDGPWVCVDATVTPESKGSAKAIESITNASDIAAGMIVKFTGGCIAGGAGTLKNGRTDALGGGIFMNYTSTWTAGALKVSRESGNLNIVGNTAATGGGVAIQGSASLYNLTVAGNYATYSSGGVDAGGTVLLFQKCHIVGNRVSASSEFGVGGGLSVWWQIEIGKDGGECSIRANTAKTSGGGVYVSGENGGGLSFFGDSVVKGNVSLDSQLASDIYLTKEPVGILYGNERTELWFENAPYGLVAYGGETYPNADAENAVAARVFFDADGSHPVAFDPGTKHGRLGVGKVAQINSTTYDTVQAAINAAGDGETVTLIGDSTEPTVRLVNKTAALDLNGHVLKNFNAPVDVSRYESMSVIYLETNGCLTVTDSRPNDAHYFKVAAFGSPWLCADYSLSAEEKSAATPIEDIADASDLAEGMAIRVQGGCLTGGKGTKEKEKSSPSSEGGGIFMETTGAPDYICGYLSMTGGNIIGNSVDDNGTSEGGGAALQGEVTLSNVFIAGNSAKTHGGGIMEYGTVTLDGSHLVGNSCFESGAGVFSWYCVTLVNNSKIVGNTAKSNGGGIVCNGSGYFKVSGSPVVRGNLSSDNDCADNVWLEIESDVQKYVTVAGALGQDAEIHITNPVGIGVQFGEVDAGYGNPTQSDADHFVADGAAQPLAAKLNEGRLEWVSGYEVTVNPVQHGTVTARPAPALDGATVILTVTPDEGYQLKSLVWNDGTDHDITEAKSFTMPLANVTVTAVFEEKPPVSAVSAEGFLDLTVGDRVAEVPEELVVVDPAWGEAKKATVDFNFGASTIETRTYNCASNDLWETTTLTPGRYTLALTAGEETGAAAFWKVGDDWVIFDSSNITADVTFEEDKTYLMLGTNTVNGNTLTVADGAKFAYGEGAGFKGGKLEAPRRYRKEVVEGGPLYRIVEAIKGCEDNPWVVGGDISRPETVIEAYTNGSELVIVGEGKIADIKEIPDDVKGDIRAITVVDAKDAEAGSFFGLDGVTVTLPDGWQGELPDEDRKWCGAENVTLMRWPLAVKNVKPQQRYPWNGKVDVDFDLTGAGDVKVTVQVTVDGKKFKNPTVDGETTFDLGKGKELKDLRLTWDAKADFKDAEKHEKIKVKLSVSPAESN